MFKGMGMGTEKRPDLVNKDHKSNPGAGYFSIPMKSAPRYGFGTEKRPEIARTKNASPAPGAYEAKKYTGDEASKISMSPKLKIDYKAKNDKLVPGPGQYVSETEKLKQTAPSFGIGTSKRADIGK